MKKEYNISSEEENQRLDRFLEKTGNLTRSQWKKRIEEGYVTVDGSPKKSGYKLRKGMTVAVEEKEKYRLTPINLSLKIFYEDPYLAIIDKPEGLVVHPGAGEEEVTLVHGLLYQFPELATGTEEFRPGIVHRLDKDTSGLMVIAKTDTTRDLLLEMFKERKVKKEYYAFVKGSPEKEGVIDTLYGRSERNRKKMAVKTEGKRALTYYNVLKNYGEASLLRVRIVTGRTHQIRVHMAHIGHPIIGDPVYGGGNPYGYRSQLLTASRISFDHPITGNKLSVTKRLPDKFLRLCRALKK